jgi:hypothetical protein
MGTSELARALSLQAQSYEFVRWLGSNQADILTLLQEEHGDRPPREVAKAWLDRFGSHIPFVAKMSEDDRDALGNLFVSYLEISFDLQGERTELRSSCGCYCFCCAGLVASSRLTPKKVGGADKERAERAIERELELMARALAPPKVLSKTQMTNLKSDPALRESLAMVAWTAALFRRIRGEYVGTEALALWRRFAWKPEGSPKPGFTLSEAAILSATKQVQAALLAATFG